MNLIESDNCITVRQLKDWLANAPDINSDDEEAQVWLESGHGLSSPLRLVMTLNKRGDLFDVFLGYSGE